MSGKGCRRLNWCIRMDVFAQSALSFIPSPSWSVEQREEAFQTFSQKLRSSRHDVTNDFLPNCKEGCFFYESFVSVTSQTYASTKSYHFLQQSFRRTIILFLLCLFVQKFRTSEAMGLKGWTTAGGQDDDASMANQFGKVLPPWRIGWEKFQ